MVGISGVLGDGAEPPEAMTEWNSGGPDERTFSSVGDRVEIDLACHSLLAGDQPASVDGGDVSIWVWGDVYGSGSGGDYTPRGGAPDGSAQFCARRYAERGMEFVSELNGDFLLVVHDRTEGTVSFVTDRVSSRPVYWTKPTSDTLVFASSVQALAHHPDVSVEFDRSYLHQYLGLRRVFGVETPLAGVREVQPAAVTTVGLDDLELETTSYWRPSYDPVDRPPSYFVEQLADILQQLFAEWTDDSLEYGLLLSGGTDSRFVEACLDQPAVAFHNTDWMSRETRIAGQIAETAGDEFRLLERCDNHESRSLERNARLSNFSGWFDQAYFTPFEDEIRDEVDVLVSGLFADTLFGDGALPTSHLSLGPVGRVDLPFQRRIRDVDDYIDAVLADADAVPYFTSDRSLRDVLAENVQATEDGVTSHGVHYESLTDLVMYGGYYPLSADTEAIFSRSLMQIRPYRTPFMDNRLLDLQQRIPAKYLLRRDLVGAALERVAPELAAIPHAGTGVPPERSFPVQYAGEYLNAFYRKFVDDESGPAPHLDHRPWPNRRELLRVRPFARDTIREKEDLLRGLPFLDYEGAERALGSHEDGADNQPVLYSLLTLLAMPLTETVHRAATTGAFPTAALAPQDRRTEREPDPTG